MVDRKDCSDVSARHYRQNHEDEAIQTNVFYMWMDREKRVVSSKFTLVL